MKKLLLVLLVGICSFKTFAQSNPYGNKYDDPSFDAMKVIKVIEPAEFNPKKLTTNLNEFKSIILQLSNRAFTQLNIDSWYKCSYEHEKVYTLFNLYYKPVTKIFFDENCKSLITLMLIDGTLKSN
mgnify:CR=1 FL=1